MIMVKLSINSKWEVVVLKGNNGYILLESLISLAVLIIIVSSYVEVTVKMQKDSQQRLSSISNYRDLYNETRRCRLHSVSPVEPQIEVSLEQGRASNRQGGILIVKNSGFTLLESLVALLMLSGILLLLSGLIQHAHKMERAMSGYHQLEWEIFLIQLDNELSEVNYIGTTQTEISTEIEDKGRVVPLVIKK